MMKKDIAIGFILFGFSVAASFQASRLDFGTLRNPEGGFFPFVLTVILGCLSIVMLVSALRSRVHSSQESRRNSSFDWPRTAFSIFLLVIFAASLEYLGYLISSFLLMFLFLWRVGKKGLWISLIIAFLITVVTYFLFGYLSDTSLPRGFLGKIRF